MYARLLLAALLADTVRQSRFTSFVAGGRRRTVLLRDVLTTFELTR